MNGSARWRVFSVELSEPLPELRPESGWEGIHIIFYFRGVPLGQYRLSSAQLPVSRQHLANCAARAIALALGDRLLEEGFQSALPGLSEPAPRDPEHALAQLV